MAERTLRILNKILDTIIAIVLILAVLYSVYSLWDNYQLYQGIQDLQVKLKDLKPKGKKPSFEELRKIKGCPLIHTRYRLRLSIQCTAFYDNNLFQTIFAFQCLFQLVVGKLYRINHLYTDNPTFFSFLKHTRHCSSGNSQIITDFLLTHIIFVIQATDFIYQPPIIYNFLHSDLLAFFS